MSEIQTQAKDVLFNDARTYNAWKEKDVDDTILNELYDLMKMGPTSANCCPARIIFLKSDEAKARLKPHLSEGNVDKTMAAPVVAIIAYDEEFHEELPFLFPHANAKSWFAGEKNKANREETAFRNGTLQGAYLIMAARAVGLDCGPMSGFDKDGVNKEFFDGTTHTANFLCNLGYGDSEGLFPRSPRFEFDQVCKVL
tara:strand:- start:882 stop:1475 length:594 start_codon:yes stop_codon:yes gene_type:complete